MNPYAPPVSGYPGYPMGAAPPPGYAQYHQQPQPPYPPPHIPYGQPPLTHSPGGRPLDGHPAGLYAPGSHHKATLSPSPSSNNLADNSPGPDMNQAERAAQVLAKTRSVMACVLCRKQKMKCEGPDKAPCRRCKAAGVECTFETPPTAAPRPRPGPNEQWVESRVIAMEDRLAQLEDALAQTSLAVAGPSNAAITSHHERRIAQLEAQLQAIQHATSAGFGLPVNQPPSLPPGFPSLGRNLHCSGREPQLIADGHREKRQRSAEPEAGDFIDRGLVSEEEARTCFEAYFLGYGNQPSGPGPAISLPFAATRSRSPLLLAVITAIGARSRSRFDTFQAALSAALLEVPAPGRDVLAGELELKALVLLGVYTGNPKVLHQAAMMCYMFDLPNALIKVGQMTPAQKASLEGQRLIVQGRTFLVCWTATHFYTTAQSEFPQQNAFNISADLIHYQLDVLEQSEFPLLPADRMLRVNIEECLILREVFEQIGPAIRIQPVTCAVVLETVDSAITRLREWSRKWADAMSLVTTWGDAENVKAAIPLHHAVLNVCYYLFGRNSSWDKMERNPRNRELARLGREAALAMMRWGVESRIWLPHSMIAVYHTFINIPTSLTVLFNVSRMFPGDLPLKTVRTLLHRVLEQSNAALNAGVAPAHELERARDTKLQVLEFDRWAFELGEEEGGEAAGAAAGTGEAENGGEENGAAKGEGGEDESLGEDMSANLGALKLDLALWGSMLVEAPEL